MIRCRRTNERNIHDPPSPRLHVSANDLLDGQSPPLTSTSAAKPK
jgi:hypothetical protein